MIKTVSDNLIERYECHDYFDITANSYKVEEYSATNFRLKGMSGSRPIYRQFVFDITLNFRVHVGNRR